MDLLIPSWRDFFLDQEKKEAYRLLKKQLEHERQLKTVYPPKEMLFEALRACSLEKLKVVIVGQDPYHGPGQAHGLCFSVMKGRALPPSLMNIYKEIERDLGIKMGPSGDLTAWAQQGILLLNSYLSVVEGEPLSHKDLGWEDFTSDLLRFCCLKKPGLIFALWGKKAQDKAELSLRGLCFENRPSLLKTTHPSPLSAHRGFLGSGHFSKINEILEKQGQKPIEWIIN